jgi:hypothetical protein
VSGLSFGRRGVHDACERFGSHALLVPERVGGDENAAGDHDGCFDDGGGDAQPDGGSKGKEGNAGKEVGGAHLGGQRQAEAAFKKRVENLKGDLEEGKGFNEKVKAFNKAVEEEGFACPPVGIENIDTRTRRKRHGTERGDEEEEREGTHRADRSRSKVVKRKVVRVNLSDEDSADEGGTGIHKDVFAKVGDITEEDIRGQKGELERLERERVEKERARKGRRKDDESESELGGGEEEYNRLLAEMKKESAKKRKRGGDGGEEGE